MNASADQRNLRTFKEATAMKRKLFRVSLNSLVTKIIHLNLFLLSRRFYHYWNGEHAEQGISHLNIPSNNVIDNIRYISVKLIDELIKT